MIIGPQIIGVIGIRQIADSKIIGTTQGLLIRRTAIAGRRTRPLMIGTSMPIGATIGARPSSMISQTIAGSRLRVIAVEVRLAMMMDAGVLSSQIVRQIAEEVKMSGMFAIEVRLAIIRMIAGDLITSKMRSRSAEVLLFLNSGLTTPWARGHRG